VDTDGAVIAIEIEGAFTNKYRVAAEDRVRVWVAFTECVISFVFRRASEASGRARRLSLGNCVSGKGGEEGGKDGKRETHFSLLRGKRSDGDGSKEEPEPEA